MRIPAVALLLSLAGCATVTADSTQTIYVNSEPAGATCELTNRAGSWTIAQTPGTALVTRSYSDLIIQCHTKSSAATRMIEPRTRDRAYGNIALLGVPAIVDAATEKGYEYDPEHVTLSLQNKKGR